MWCRPLLALAIGCARPDSGPAPDRVSSQSLSTAAHQGGEPLPHDVHGLLAITRASANGSVLAVISVGDGVGPLRILHREPSAELFEPIFSADGEAITFVRDVGGSVARPEIWVHTLDDGRTEKLADCYREGEHPLAPICGGHFVARGRQLWMARTVDLDKQVIERLPWAQRASPPIVAVRPSQYDQCYLRLVLDPRTGAALLAVDHSSGSARCDPQHLGLYSLSDTGEAKLIFALPDTKTDIVVGRDARAYFLDTDSPASTIRLDGADRTLSKLDPLMDPPFRLQAHWTIAESSDGLVVVPPASSEAKARIVLEVSPGDRITGFDLRPASRR